MGEAVGPIIGAQPKTKRGNYVKNVRITIKNYRGFADQEPAIFEIGQGFTAFFGKE